MSPFSWATNVLPARKVALPVVRMPGLSPGERKPPLLTVTAPENEPVPPSVAPLSTVTVPEPAPEPVVAEAAPAAPVARIVDPEVAEEADAPLFAEPAFEPRKPRGGFLSIFGGRPRYDSTPAAAPAPQPVARATAAPVRGGAQPLEAQLPADEADQNEDLEIPSFLRRLAN